mgnify:FL=1
MQKLPLPDCLSICQLLMLLDTPKDTATVFDKLLRTEDKINALLATSNSIWPCKQWTPSYLCWKKCNQNSERNVSHTDPKETIYADWLSKIKELLSNLKCVIPEYQP